jgi:putative iron-regulated protein
LNFLVGYKKEWKILSNQLKLWTGLGIGLSVLANTTSGVLAEATSTVPAKAWIMAQATSDGGGEGEGGGETPATYALASTDTDAFRFDASPQIKAYADLAYTSYAKARSDAQAMETAIDVMLAGPSDTSLAAAREAWVKARPAYLHTEAFRFYDGPIEEIEGFINAWPMNEAYIDYVEGNPKAGIINDASFSIEQDAIRHRNQADDEANVTTGWHAIEFLLWGQDLSASGPGNRPHTDYVAGTEASDRRRVYLKIVTEKLVQDLKGLEEAWKPSADNYAAKFLALPQAEALGRIINGIAVLTGFEFMSERLAVALDSGDQEDEHSCFSDTTKQDFVHDLVGIRQVWTGDGDGVTRPGMDELLRARDPALADAIDKQLAETEAKIADLGDPWDQVLAKGKSSPERKAAEEAVVALQALGGSFKAAGAKLGVLVLIPSQ